MAIVTSKGLDPSTVHSTPRAVTRALLAHLRLGSSYTWDLLQRGAVWEPACGSMAIVRELELADPPPPRIISSDVYLREGATFRQPLDFLTQTDPPEDVAHRPRLIITNPPFSLATQFMDIGLRWIIGVPGAGLALFLPLGALGGQKRASTTYAQYPPTQILIMSERVDIFPDGYVPEPGKHRGGVIEYGWFLWYTDQTHGQLLTRSEQAEHGIEPLAWVKPGVLAELDPEAAQARKDRARRNKQHAAALSRSRRRRAIVSEGAIPEQENEDGGDG
jgi:hypothetical protein